MDNVRWIVNQKLNPLHFQIKLYYLSGTNYPTDKPRLIRLQCENGQCFARENENMLNKQFCPGGI